jgi:hypothetical protein
MDRARVAAEELAPGDPGTLSVAGRDWPASFRDALLAGS